MFFISSFLFARINIPIVILNWLLKPNFFSDQVLAFYPQIGYSYILYCIIESILLTYSFNYVFSVVGGYRIAFFQNLLLFSAGVKCSMYYGMYDILFIKSETNITGCPYYDSIIHVLKQSICQLDARLY